MITDLETAAVTRDLVRRPDVRQVAFILATIQASTGSVVDADNLDTSSVMLAYRLLKNKSQRDLLINALQLFGR